MPIEKKPRVRVGASITFIEQDDPVDEYGRALYAVARSILRALIDSMTDDDLTDINTPLDRVTLRQLARLARIDRDKGMRGDGLNGRFTKQSKAVSPKLLNLYLLP